jgi:hypothetical protein
MRGVPKIAAGNSSLKAASDQVFIEYNTSRDST